MPFVKATTNLITSIAVDILKWRREYGIRGICCRWDMEEKRRLKGDSLGYLPSQLLWSNLSDSQIYAYFFFPSSALSPSPFPTLRLSFFPNFFAFSRYVIDADAGGPSLWPGRGQ
jgi:hypothetical protein